jgi:HisJ family histidinol phosphate phosphatase
MVNGTHDKRVDAIPDVHGHAKGEHKPYAEERPIPYSARMLFLWFYHACRRQSPRFLMVADHMNYLTFEDPAAVNLVRRALKLAQAGDLYGAAETAGVELQHAAVVSEGLRKGMRYSIGAEVDNDPRCRPDAQNIVDAMKPDGMIRSVHFLQIDHPVHGAGWFWPFDNEEFRDTFEVVGIEKTWELYMARLLDDIDKLPGNVVGHFYAPAKFGHWPDDAKLQEYEDQLVAMCAERNFAIELNSRYFYRFFLDDPENLAKYRAVSLRLLGKAKEKGVLIAVGSDAHSPKDQGGSFDDVLSLLDAAGINEIAFPINGRLARVALKVTEEILKQHAVAPAPPIGSSVVGFSRSELTARNGGVPLPDETEDLVPAKAAARRVKAAVKAKAEAGEAAEAKPAPAVKAVKAAKPPKAAPDEKPIAAPKPAPAPKAAAAPKPVPAVKAPPAKAASAKAPVKTKAAPAPKAAPKPPVKAPKPAAKTATRTKPAPKARPALKKAAAKRSVAPAKPAAKKKAPAKKAAVARRSVKAAPAAKKTAAKARKSVVAKRAAAPAKRVAKKAPAKKAKSRSRR